jgi:hypothetical protein
VRGIQRLNEPLTAARSDHMYKSAVRSVLPKEGKVIGADRWLLYTWVGSRQRS